MNYESVTQRVLNSKMEYSDKIIVNSFISSSLINNLDSKGLQIIM